MRPIAVLAPILIGCTLLTTGCAKLNFWKRAESSKTLSRGPCVGTVAPEIEGEDFDGNHVKLSDYRGKVVVVAFWASWCKPCRDMIPHERALVERYAGKPFVMLGVNNDENPNAARKVIASEGMCWPSCQTGGSENEINERWNIEYLPSLYVIDGAGVVRYARVTGASLDRAVDTLLAEAERNP